MFQTDKKKALGQKTFDAVAKHLAGMTDRCMSHDLCMYRGAKGAMCAIGSLIPDSVYDARWEGSGIDNPYIGLEIVASVKEAGFSNDTEFLAGLQLAHDAPPCPGKTWQETSSEALDNLAMVWGLKPYRLAVRTEKPAVRVEKPGTKRFIASIYRKAADFFDTHNWCKGLFHNPKDDSYCAVGGFRAVATEGSYVHGALREEKILSFAVAGKFMVMMVYNDLASTTKADIQRFMRGVAYMLEHGGRLPPWAKAMADKRADKALLSVESALTEETF